ELTSHRRAGRALRLHRTASPELSPLSLHDALPICNQSLLSFSTCQSSRSLRWVSTACNSTSSTVPSSSRISSVTRKCFSRFCGRSEEHTSELQSRENLVCRLLLEKKNERREGRPAR